MINETAEQRADRFLRVLVAIKTEVALRAGARLQFDKGVEYEKLRIQKIIKDFNVPGEVEDGK